MLWAVSVIYRASVFIKLEGPVPGTIIGLQNGLLYSRRMAARVKPEIVFTAKDGKRVTFTNPVSTTRFKARIGNVVSVYYSPQHPERARTPMPVEWVFWPMLIGVMSVWFGVKSRKEMPS